MFCFFKQKTAYEMRISDWSSDVCSSDLPVIGYLNAHNIVNLAVASGCDALHPGYGFLSENPELAEICARRGIKFIGPSGQVIRQMGVRQSAVEGRSVAVSVDLGGRGITIQKKEDMNYRIHNKNTK